MYSTIINQLSPQPPWAHWCTQASTTAVAALAIYVYVYVPLPLYSPEWHSLYLPSDVATLQSGRHCGTYPPSDLMPSPSRASCSQSYPNVRPTVADAHVAVPSCAPDPATHDSIRRYPVRLADDCVRPLDGWAIVPADSLAQDRCSGSAAQQQQRRHNGNRVKEIRCRVSQRCD